MLKNNHSQVQKVSNQLGSAQSDPSDCEPLWESGSSLGSRGEQFSDKLLQLNKIYVIGVPLKVATSQKLRSLNYFGQFGTISSVFIDDSYFMSEIKQYRKKVYITFERPESAAFAILSLKVAKFKNFISASYAINQFCAYQERCQFQNCFYVHSLNKEMYLQRIKIEDQDKLKNNKILFEFCQ